MLEDYEPQKLSLATQGWGAEHIIWNSARREFFWGSGSWLDVTEESPFFAEQARDREEDDDRTLFPPSRHDWNMFWRIAELIGVWEWEGHHALQFIFDADEWRLSIAFQDRELRATGSYYDPLPSYFDLFERSLDALIGRPLASRKESVLQAGEIETLSDLVELAVVVHSVRSNADDAGAKLIEYVKSHRLAGHVLGHLIVDLGLTRPESLPDVIRHIDGNENTPRWNILAYEVFKARVPEALPLLFQLIEKPAEFGWFIRHAAKKTLIEIGADQPYVAERLPAMLQSTSAEQVALAKQIKGIRTPPGESALAIRARRLQDERRDTRLSAICDLRDFLVTPEESSDFLQRACGETTILRFCLSHSDPSLRAAVARWLGIVGARAKEELPFLIELLADEDKDVRISAQSAISQIATPSVAAELISRLLDDPEDVVRAEVIGELQKLGNAAESAVRHLLRIVASGSKSEAKLAIDAIYEIASDPVELLPEIEELLSNPRSEARLSAIYGLRKLGGDSPRAVHSIVDSCEDPDLEVRRMAISCLCDLRGESAAIALPALCRLLRDAELCGSVANVISTLREEAVDAIPDLMEVLISGEVEGSNAFCIARTLYELSPDFAKLCDPEVVHNLTRIGNPPIWRDEGLLD